MDKLISNMFSTDRGASVYSAALNTIVKYAMRDMLDSGVLVGLSGGADSVMLLLLLIEFRIREQASFPIIAVHVNHMIRGKEADRDEKFSRDLAEACGVEFTSRKVDVPAIAKELGVGVEEAARNVRYSEFEKIISGRNDISVIATAHNATDNAETVLFNIARGCGARGAAGIAPIRDNIVRPLISVEKSDITNALDLAGIKYMTDSTNYSTEYSRNYIRHNILPLLERINSNYIASISAFSASLREDVDFIELSAVDFLNKHRGAHVTRSDLVSLHPSLLSRVILLLAKEQGLTSLERVHVSHISQLLRGDNFKYSVPSGYTFLCERGICRFVPSLQHSDAEFYQELNMGANKLSGYNAVISLGAMDDSSRKVYKFSIHADLSSAIINGSLYVRFRKNGDSYRYGSMTRKLKKVFNDMDIPPSIRDRIPIVCDENGVLWVPGLPVRDDGVRGVSLPITFSVLLDSDDLPTFAVGMTE